MTKLTEKFKHNPLPKIFFFVLILSGGLAVYLILHHSSSDNLAMARTIVLNASHLNAKGEPELTVICEDNFPPFSYKENGALRGYNVDLIRKLEALLNVKLRLESMDWANAYSRVQSGKTDILVGISYNDNRAKTFDFSQRILTLRGRLFVAHESFHITRPEDIPYGHPIGVEKGDILESYLISNYPKLSLMEFTNQKDGLEAVSRHEIEAFAGDYHAGISMIHRFNMDNSIKVVGPPLLEGAYCLAVKKGNPRLISALNEGLDSLRNDGEMKTQEDNWFGEGYMHSPTIWLPVLYALVAVSLLALALIVWNRTLQIAVRLRTDELKEAQSRLSVAMTHGKVGTWEYRPETDQFITSGMNELMGYSEQELGNTFNGWLKHVTDPVDQQAITSELKRVMKLRSGSFEVEHRFKHKDGAVRWLFSQGMLVVDKHNDNMILQGASTDITHIKETEQTLRSSEEKFAHAFHSSPDALGISRLSDGRFLEVNEGFLSMTGYALTDIIDKTVSELGLYVDIELQKTIFTRLIQTKSLRDEEVLFKRKDGNVFTGLISGSIIELEREPCALIIIRDITEKRRLQEQLLQSQKQEGIGRLAGGIAHDFNNLLTAIIGYGELSLTQLPDSNPVRPHLKQILQASERASGLTRQLLAFARKQIIAPQIVNINDLTMKMDQMLRRMLGEDIEMVTRQAANLPLVKVDPGQIEQVIMNMVINSRDAMPSGGKIILETSRVELDETYQSLHQDALPGVYVQISVTDSGSGISKDALPYIFEPFFTTRAVGKGTGLGLSTCYGIVRQNGGSISVYSEEGHGTTFRVYLPISQEQIIQEIQKPAEVPARGNEVILAVEDEPLVRQLMKRIMVMQGYHVITAESGMEALELAEAYEGKIDMLLTDVIMPRMSGKQLADRMIMIRPDIKILYVSGYTENSVVQHGILEAGIAFLPKPYTPHTLAQKVRETLDATPKQASIIDKAISN